MSTGNLTRNSQEFFLKYPPNGKAAGVSQTQTAFDRTTTDAKFTEKSSTCHIGDAPALLGHRVVHCAVGTPGYIVVEVSA